MNTFDPAAQGATPFDPTKEGATPVQPSGGGLLNGGGRATHNNSNKPMGAADFLNPLIEAANNISAGQAQAVNNPANKGNIGQSIVSAAQATGNAMKNTIGNPAVVGDAATAASMTPEGAALTGAIGGKAAEVVGNVVGKIPGANTVGNAIKTAGAMVKYPTLQKAAQASTNAAAKASAQGAATTWDDLSYLIRKEAEKQFGTGNKVTDAVSELLSEKTPPAIDSMPNSSKFTPSDLLQWRRQIQARGASSGILQNLFKGTNIDDKVASVARRVISQEIHSQAPGTVTPDKVYSLFKTLKGDVPTWAKRALGYGVVKKAFGDKTGGLIGQGIDVLGALGGEKIIP